MTRSANASEETKGSTWVYVSLAVIDGPRTLKPAQVASDRILFTTPPKITSERVELVLTNGDSEYRQYAAVLPHDAEATRIPIKLLGQGRPV